MLVAYCIDNNGGLIFNNRRLSRDKALCDDFVSTARNKIYAQDYSKTLFESYFSVSYAQNPFDISSDDDSVFIESLALSPYTDRIDKIYVYKWNRDYPSDMKIDIDPLALGFKLADTVEFKGNSHDKISKEIYVR